MKLLTQNSLKVIVRAQIFLLSVVVAGSLLGVCLGQNWVGTDFSMLAVGLAAVTLLGLGIWLFSSRARLLAIACVLASASVSVGFLRFYVAAEEWRSETIAVQALSGELVTGTVVSRPLVSATPSGRKISFEFLPDNFSGRLKVSWYRAGSAQLAEGERWQLPIRVQWPDGFDNVGVGRYAEWLAANNVIGRGYLSRFDRAVKLAPAAATISPADTRERLADVVDYWVGRREAQPVIQTLVTGERFSYSDELKQTIRQAGISHLLAISGLHIGIAAGIGALLCRALLGSITLASGWQLSWWSRRCLLLSSAGLVAFMYAWISGFAIPTQRALMMLAVVSLCLLTKRSPRPIVVLLWVLLGVIFYDPMAPLLAGFWLSFAAVAVILISLSGRKYRTVEVEGRLPTFALWLWRQVSLLFRLQLALSIGLMPLTMVFFSQVSLVSPVANFVAVPLFSFLVVPIALLSAVAGSFWLPLGAPLVVAERIAHWVIVFSEWLLAVANSVGTAVWTSGAFNSVGVAVLLLGLALIYLPRGLGLRPVGILLLALSLFSPASRIAERPEEGVFRLAMLDVGHGLAVHIQTRNHDLLYDTGPSFSSGNSAANIVIAPYLRSQGISDLDDVVVSHSDSDHSGGLDVLSDAFELGVVRGWEGGTCTVGTAWEYDGVSFTVLSPQAESEHITNNQSCVIRIDSPAGSALLTGDIEKPAERKMLSSLSAVDLITVPHHGSKTSSHSAWLDLASPQIALISAAKRGRFKLPSESVVKRYQESNVEVYTTGEYGSISVNFSTVGGITIAKSRDSTPWWLAGLR